MAAVHLELLVEEPSMEAFLRGLLPRLLPRDRRFEIHAFQGKDDLLRNLATRLRGYAHWLPPDWLTGAFWSLSTATMTTAMS